MDENAEACLQFLIELIVLINVHHCKTNYLLTIEQSIHYYLPMAFQYIKCSITRAI